MFAWYILLLVSVVQDKLIEPDRIGRSTIPDQSEIETFLSQNRFETKALEEEALQMEFFFAHGFESCWADCWRNCVWTDTTYSSSHLSSVGNISYGPQNADDSDLRTAWIENSADYGVGESLTVSMSTIESNQIKISRLIIVNGYTKSFETWRNNSRVKRLRVICNGASIGTLSLRDTDHYQSFEIGDLVSRVNNRYVFKFEVVDTYPGDKYKDTALSEILFEGVGCL